jgi:hypothetical protein
MQRVREVPKADLGNYSITSLRLIAQRLLDQMIVGKRAVKKKPKDAAIGYYMVAHEDAIEHYVRSGSVAIARWSPPDKIGEVDRAFNWKTYGFSTSPYLFTLEIRHLASSGSDPRRDTETVP